MNYIKEFSVTFVLILIVILIRTFIITPAIINGDSMEPSLNDGNLVFLKKYNKNYERFEIIVHKYEENRLVKRIIGMPGEHIAFEDSKLYVDGVEIEDVVPYTPDFDLTRLGIEVIPDDHYFVMGDNRSFSKDSRTIGPIHKDNIIGRTSFRIYPFNKIGKID